MFLTCREPFCYLRPLGYVGNVKGRIILLGFTPHGLLVEDIF